MTWIYLLLVGSVLLSILGGLNPLASPFVWILAVVIGVQRFAHARRRTGKTAVTPGETAVPLPIAPDTGSAGIETDMFVGLRGWREGDGPAEIATAACSLAGRSDAHVRALLVMGSLRGDEPGRIVAAAARRLLTPVSAR